MGRLGLVLGRRLLSGQTSDSLYPNRCPSPNAHSCFQKSSPSPGPRAPAKEETGSLCQEQSSPFPSRLPAGCVLALETSSKGRSLLAGGGGGGEAQPNRKRWPVFEKKARKGDLVPISCWRGAVCGRGEPWRAAGRTGRRTAGGKNVLGGERAAVSPSLPLWGTFPGSAACRGNTSSLAASAQGPGLRVCLQEADQPWGPFPHLA